MKSDICKKRGSLQAAPFKFELILMYLRLDFSRHFFSKKNFITST